MVWPGSLAKPAPTLANLHLSQVQLQSSVICKIHNPKEMSNNMCSLLRIYNASTGDKPNESSHQIPKHAIPYIPLFTRSSHLVGISALRNAKSIIAVRKVRIHSRGPVNPKHL